MFRTLIVLAALALSGCASYGPSYRDARAPVYRDGSYYSPSASGYGDYYYAPEYRYDYYDDFGYGYGFGYGSPYDRYGYGYGYGGNRFCSFRYRPCGYGSYWGSGWGWSLFSSRGWNHWDPWYGWPYYGWHRDRDWDHRDRDWRNRPRDGSIFDRPREPNPPYTGGDRNRNPNPTNPPGAGTGWPLPGNVRPPRSDRPIDTREPYPVIRDRNRNPGYRDERGAMPMPVPRDRYVTPAPRDRNGGGNPGYVPQPRAPEPRDRNRGGGGYEQPQPQPRAPEPRDRNEDRSQPPPPVRRERGGERRDNARRDGEGRPALQ